MLRISSIQLNKASAYQRAARWTCCRVSPVWRSYSSAIPPLKPIRERRNWDIRVTSSTLWKSEMRVIVATFMGLVALAVAPVQAAPNPDKDNWVQLGAARSFELGDQACGVGRHRTIDRSYLPFLDDRKPRDRASDHTPIWYETGV